MSSQNKYNRDKSMETKNAKLCNVEFFQNKIAHWSKWKFGFESGLWKIFLLFDNCLEEPQNSISNLLAIPDVKRVEEHLLTMIVQ